MDTENNGAYGCSGCLGIIILILLVICFFVDSDTSIFSMRKAHLQKKAEQAKQKIVQKNIEEQQAKEKQKRMEARQRQEAKDKKIQAFAIKEAPKVWSVYQALRSEIFVLNDKLQELRKALLSLGKLPEQDADYNCLCSQRDEMILSVKALRSKLEEAYIAAKKYEAAPDRIQHQALLKKVLKDGILEADAASDKFKELRLKK